ncbi:MAG: sigma-70 family RNA polymerase sigma factor [Gemmatimonadota bacterium]|nr:sigma-70 family RNA polymerase sigma factor [Gemmatimonadota bacterium]
MTPSDAILMQRIVARDQEAFAILFARYQAQVTESLRWITRDPVAADDLTQEVFLRVWNRADQWSGQGSFRGWLFRIARNLSLNQLRSQSRRREQPLEMPSLYDEEDEEQPVPGWMIDRAALGPDVQLERAEQRRILQALIDALPEEKREIFQMVYEDEVALREVAERLAIPEGTVKSRLFHARKQLAGAWSRRYGRG